MATPAKSAAAGSVLQRVTIPAPLAAEIRRIAKDQHVSMKCVLIAMAERGARAEIDAKAQLSASYQRFLEARDPAIKVDAGEDLIRAIFGTDAITDDSVR
jgi:hypothetical protein